MKTEHIPEQKLQSIRALLPWGAQTKIAQSLSTPDFKLTPQVVNKVLHNIPVRAGICDPMAIITEAVKLIKGIQESKTTAEALVDEVLNTAKEQQP